MTARRLRFGSHSARRQAHDARRASPCTVHLRLALLGAVVGSLDRSRRIVFGFIAVVLGEYTIGDPALWIAPLRPLLSAPLASATGYLPCPV